MALFKKNIWLLFYIFLAIATTAFVFFIYLQWQHTYHNHKTEQENIVSILSNTTNSLLQSEELVLDILGKRFFEDKTYKDYDKARDALSKLTVINPAIIAFGLVKPDGEFMFISSQKDLSTLPNLKEQKQSKDSFIQTLKSKDMVLGRTYYFAPLKEYVLPIRKAIRDANGEVIAVMTAALDLEKVFGSMEKVMKNDKKFSFAILREFDKYLQYKLGNDSSIDPYEHPYKTEYLQKAYSSALKRYALSIEDIKSQENIVTIQTKNLDNTFDIIASTKYNNKYGLWVIVQTKFDTIYNEFLKLTFLFSIIFILITISIFYLTRVVSLADKKRNDALIYQATHDSLSGLPNRNYLKSNLNLWFDELNEPFALFSLDMDKFKSVNDTLGHEAGDKVLQEIAKRLKMYTPEDSLIIRYGGDEFIILIRESNNHKLLNYAHKIINELSKPYKLDTFIFNLGASIGIAKYPEHGNTLDTLLRAGDIAMYEAKKSTNVAHIFADNLQDGYLQNLRIEQALKSALENDEFNMVYQPQFDKNGKLYGVESLIRWNSSKMGFVPPNEFIPIAESSGFMNELGNFIIEASLKEAKEIQEKTNLCFKVSINISMKQFMEPNFFEFLLQSIKNNELCCGAALTLEITESLFIDDVDYILPLLHKIKEEQIEISMDDFGTGYSSLSALKKLPIDELKIDKSFVDDILEDEMAKKMIKNIIDIGKNLDMKILAEGVEELEQKELLTKLGCDRFQGYYFAKPLAKNSLIEFLETNIVSQNIK